MISKVDELREFLGPDMSGFVGHLQNIARVHEVSTSKHLDIDEARAMFDPVCCHFTGVFKWPKSCKTPTA